MKHKICIAGAGGQAGIGLTRCLQQDPELEVVGYDSSRWGELAMECPLVEDPNLCDMVIPVPDALVRKWGLGINKGEETGPSDLCFLPTPEMIELCQDKAKCAKALGDKSPKIHWVRDTHGAGGAGAQMASEFLPGRNYSVELVFYKGELKYYFMKERLAYDIKGSTDPLWQRGSSVVSKAISSAEDTKLLYMDAVAAIWRITDSMGWDYKIHHHGIFSIDYKEDENGIPKITEINPGRFLTASYSFYNYCNYNLPLAAVKLFFNEPYQLGEFPHGKTVIRQTDSLPKFV